MKKRLIILLLVLFVVIATAVVAQTDNRVMREEHKVFKAPKGKNFIVISCEPKTHDPSFINCFLIANAPEGTPFWADVIPYDVSIYAVNKVIWDESGNKVVIYLDYHTPSSHGSNLIFFDLGRASVSTDGVDLLLNLHKSETYPRDYYIGKAKFPNAKGACLQSKEVDFYKPYIKILKNGVEYHFMWSLTWDEIQTILPEKSCSNAKSLSPKNKASFIAEDIVQGFDGKILSKKRFLGVFIPVGS